MMSNNNNNASAPILPAPVVDTTKAVTHNRLFLSRIQRKEFTYTVILHAVFAIMAFEAIVLLTPPITTCFYSNISDVLVRAIPVTVAALIAFLMGLLLDEPKTTPWSTFPDIEENGQPATTPAQRTSLLHVLYECLPTALKASLKEHLPYTQCSRQQ
jgi:hypothetical protein